MKVMLIVWFVASSVAFSDTISSEVVQIEFADMALCEQAKETLENPSYHVARTGYNKHPQKEVFKSVEAYCVQVHYGVGLAFNKEEHRKTQEDYLKRK